MRIALAIAIALGFCFSFMVAAPAHAELQEQEKEQSTTTLSFHPGLGVIAYSGGIASTSRLTARLRLRDHFFVDIVGKSGQLFAEDNLPNHLYLALGVGPGLSTGPGLDRWEVRLSPRFTHVHHASTDSWRATPFKNLTGDSGGGVEHRSGIELALGVTSPAKGSLRNVQMIWSADLLLNHLPSSDPMRNGVGAMISATFTRQ